MPEEFRELQQYLTMARFLLHQEPLSICGLPNFDQQVFHLLAGPVFRRFTMRGASEHAHQTIPIESATAFCCQYQI